MDCQKKDASESFQEMPVSQNAEERFLVDMFGQITERLKQKYNYSSEDISKLWGSSNEIFVPVLIFAGKLSPSEALAKYLKENCGIGFVDIAKIIQRDQRAIWANYRRAVKKMPWPFDIKESAEVPVSVFTAEKSILESLVSYLKEEKKLRNKKIAQLLNKSPANIWTVYNRAKKKSRENENQQ